MEATVTFRVRDEEDTSIQTKCQADEKMETILKRLSETSLMSYVSEKETFNLNDFVFSYKKKRLRMNQQ